MTSADIALLIQAGFHHEIQDWEDGETPDSHTFHLGDIEIGETVATCPQPWVVLRTDTGDELGHGELVECIAIAKNWLNEKTHILSMDPTELIGSHALIVMAKIDFGHAIAQFDDRGLFTGRILHTDGYVYQYDVPAEDWRPIVFPRTVDAERALLAHIEPA